MSSHGPSLPPKLVNMIVQYLSDDKRALRSCTLSVDRQTRRDAEVERLRRCFPSHLHVLPRICGFSSPNLVFMEFYFLDTGRGNNGAIQSYFDLIQISRSPRLVELDFEFISNVEDFHAAFEALEGTNIKRVTLSGVFDEPAIVGVGASVKRLHLPLLELIGMAGRVASWIPPLKFFKFEMTDDLNHHLEYMDYHGSEDALCPLPLAGLHFQHVHLGIDCGSEYPCQVIKWWSSTFRAMSDSKGTIHFTELTFTFTDPENDALKAAWQSLDDILSHPVFSTVRSIHFEKSDQNVLITQTVYPALADKAKRRTNVGHPLVSPHASVLIFTFLYSTSLASAVSMPQLHYFVILYYY
ncbi:hypothetical protein BDZ89DRAFT_1044226 [Hymenopellis radicata]|nr:hypothetical protein BDZ89DRAFT_1044226 [Hymenopellis radicata]